jgi:hypothetical protein
MKAATPLKAGEAAIKIADNERPERYKLESWDPAATFVADIRRGGSLSDNELNLDPIMEALCLSGSARNVPPAAPAPGKPLRASSTPSPC